jgi:hypothetical protein
MVNETSLPRDGGGHGLLRFIFFKAGCSIYRGCHRQHPHQTTRRTTLFRATSYKLQSVFGLVRTLGGSEQLAWTLQWTMSGTVVVSVVMLWRSRADYALKAAALAAGTQLLTPYLFLYDMMVLAIPAARNRRLGIRVRDI